MILTPMILPSSSRGTAMQRAAPLPAPPFLFFVSEQPYGFVVQRTLSTKFVVEPVAVISNRPYMFVS